MKSLFIGYEVEGPYTGELTLFIPNNAKNRHDFLIEANKRNIKRLYFGAGNDRGINKDISDYLLSTIPSYFKILLEIDTIDQLKHLSKSFLTRTKVIYVIPNYTYVKPIKVFKTVTESKVYWYELEQAYITKLEDPEYEKDEEI